MRFVSVRNLSLLAFILLLSWEAWKAVITTELRHRAIRRITEAFEASAKFDEKLLTNEYLVTENSVDVEYAAVQRLRKKVLKTGCHQRKVEDVYPLNTDFNKGINPSAFRNILVSDKHQLLYCITPKVACTNWKRVLLVLDGYFTDPNNITASLAHDFNQGYFRRLSDYTPDEINLRLSTYYKFLFARHPFERLTAAYRNKFIYQNTQNKFFSVIFGQFIRRKYRHHNSTTTKKSSVTFAEFVQYIVDSPLEDKEFWNEHWERIERLCLPCLIQYDFIGKFETLKQDADFLLRTLDVNDLVKFPDGYKGHASSTPSLMRNLFESLPKRLLEKLYELYKMDFMLFGYQNGFES
ncbi:carbohydrate sulfotransferase 13-like [Clytia hemisphaerica]|uniref:Carbohydrate sulfotransferase n=1 Tax=Clytia hemisphaerica TaxID=252671 RepID=A0A7M5VD97_9CNID